MLHRRTCLLALPAVTAWPGRAQAMAGVLAAYEHSTGGQVGLYVQDVASGARITWRDNQRFVMCSTFKASLAALVLARIDQGQDDLQQVIHYGPADLPGDWYAPVARRNLATGAMSVSEMCEAAVVYSDNTCANLLLARVGGPAALTGFWRSLGDAVTRLDHTEPMLNRSPPGDPHDTTTPAAMAGNLRHLLLGDALVPNARKRLTGWMLGCQTGANRLRAGLPVPWRIGDKTGNNGADASGDIAVAWRKPDAPVLISAYTQGGSPTQTQLDDLFAAIGRMIGRRFG